MRLRSDRRRRPLLAATVLLLVLCAPAWAQRPAAEVQRRQAAAPTRSEVEQALRTVEADPNLSAERTIRTLRWRHSPARESRGLPAWLGWIAGLFLWFARTGRVLIWVAVVLAAGFLGVYVLRVLRARGKPRAPEERFDAPTHVRDLDVRPDSLPEDVGAAARALWHAGEHRPALALLYRGLLSRLIHAYDVPIRDSSTEGDCLRLAGRRVGAERSAFALRLVNVWQLAVYAGEQPATADVDALCGAFAATLDSASAAPPDAREGPPGAGRT